ncbi:hypothetical protein DPMN_101816 [Dreissena polymorpha]|uniref:Uncharacterized protein n=1 Tax=Dreissena polymorpha TaxID=45954 RepID=A0A9D4LJJ6_DREPO|nr:hypothetical protein DPMN_101816 [Dreissena polymorpha]
MTAVGFEPTPPKRLVPKTRALDRSATLPCDRKVLNIVKICMAAVGFEPTPPKRLVPKTSALDRSATLPCHS